MKSLFWWQKRLKEITMYVLSNIFLDKMTLVRGGGEGGGSGDN